MNRSTWRSRPLVALLLALLVLPSRALAQEGRPHDASAIGVTLGAVVGIVVGMEIASRVGDPGNCMDPCRRRDLALPIEAAAVALGATAGNRGRGSFLADLAVSGVAVALFADAARQEQYGVALLALGGQLFGVIATEVLTSPRVPVSVSVMPRADGLEVGLAFGTAR